MLKGLGRAGPAPLAEVAVEVATDDAHLENKELVLYRECGEDVVDNDDDDGVQAYMVAVFSQPVARPAERVIILAHLKITIVNIVAIFIWIVFQLVIIFSHLVIAELVTVASVLLPPSVEDAAKQTVDEHHVNLVGGFD